MDRDHGKQRTGWQLESALGRNQGGEESSREDQREMHFCGSRGLEGRQSGRGSVEEARDVGSTRR